MHGLLLGNKVRTALDKGVSQSKRSGEAILGQWHAMTEIKIRPEVNLHVKQAQVLDFLEATYAGDFVRRRCCPD